MAESRAAPAVVLVVEDELLIRMDTALLIEDDGYIVHQAANADQAILILERHPEIRVIFTDVHMPGSMDGLKLAHYVRGRWPPIKIILTSGHAMLQPEEMPTGGMFVPKPYRAHQITGALRAVLG